MCVCVCVCVIRWFCFYSLFIFIFRIAENAAISINKGLVCLGRVISTLVQRATLSSKILDGAKPGQSSAKKKAKELHVPYRDSILTQMLRVGGGRAY